MGAYDVRFWLISKDRAITLENTGSITAANEPVQIISFPATTNERADPSYESVREWLLSRGVTFKGITAIRDGMSIDMHEEGQRLADARITMPIHSWMGRQIATGRQIDAWVEFVIEMSTRFDLRIVDRDGEVASSDLRSVVISQASKMGLRSPPT